jgi:GntR family transcriptional regulator/MocR family aminotransferase
MVAPLALIPRIEAVKSLTNRHTPLLEQAVLAEFMAEGHFARHIRRMRETYAQRLAVLLESAGRDLRGLLEIPPIEAGLQIVGWLRQGVSAEGAASAAGQAGVEVTPLSRYGSARGPREGIQLGFAPLRPKEIEEGVRRLAVAWKNLRSKPKAKPIR